MTAAQLSSSPPRQPSALDSLPHLQAMPVSDCTPSNTSAPSNDDTSTVRSPLGRQGIESKPGNTATVLVELPKQQAPVLKPALAASSASNMGKTMVTSSVDGRRPSTPRAQTDPSSPSPFDTLPTHHTRPRNRSPYSRSHLRSHSGSSSPSAPPMMRAHSLPSVISPSGYLALSPSPVPGRPSSPLRSPKRTRSPRSQPTLYEDTYAHAGTPSVCDISEDAELELTPRPGPLQPSPLSGLYSASGSLSRRRRPASPLHQVAFGGAVSAPTVRTPTSDPASPMLSAAKFNEPFPGANSYYPSSHASSSVPSTPTSMRSRSPSISSLETIEDTPDEEAEAIEADRLARLKAAVDREEEGAEGGRRSSLDIPGGSGRAFGGKRDTRKRWSVCGAERRGDLDLETIWED